MAKSEPKRHPLNQSIFFRVKTRAKLASIFGIAVPDLRALGRLERPYNQWVMEEKKKGKVKLRPIQEPRGPLRPVHERVGSLLSKIEPPDFLFCPVKRRSYISNAAHHLGAKQVRTLDIKNFFPSTPEHRVFWFFQHVMECESDVAAILAQLLTVDGHLATGSAASPILAFFAFYDMWQNISALVTSARCTLSVYIDDIAISGDVVPDGLIWEIQKQIHSRGLKYHKERHFLGGTAEVTGVVLRNGKTLLPNRQHLKAYLARQALLEAKDPDSKAAIAQTLAGLRSQRKQIES